MSSCYRHGWVRRHFFPILLAHSHLLSLTFPAVPSAHFLFSAHSVPFLLLLCISPCSSSFPSPIIHPIIPARQPLFHLLLTMFKQVIQVATNSMKSQFSPQPSSSKHSANFHRYSTLFSQNFMAAPSLFGAPLLGIPLCLARYFFFLLSLMRQVSGRWRWWWWLALWRKVWNSHEMWSYWHGNNSVWEPTSIPLYLSHRFWNGLCMPSLLSSISEQLALLAKINYWFYKYFININY